MSMRKIPRKSMIVPNVDPGACWPSGCMPPCIWWYNEPNIAGNKPNPIVKLLPPPITNPNGPNAPKPPPKPPPCGTCGLGELQKACCCCCCCCCWGLGGRSPVGRGPASGWPAEEAVASDELAAPSLLSLDGPSNGVPPLLTLFRRLRAPRP